MALVVKNLPVNAGDRRNWDSIPGSERSPEADHGNPLQYSCLEKPRDRGAWWATVHGVSKSQTWLKQLNTPTHTHTHTRTHTHTQTNKEPGGSQRVRHDWVHTHTHTPPCIYMCVYIYTYIYIERERERENFCSDNEKTVYLINSHKFSMPRKYCKLFWICLRIK